MKSPKNEEELFQLLLSETKDLTDSFLILVDAELEYLKIEKNTKSVVANLTAIYNTNRDRYYDLIKTTLPLRIAAAEARTTILKKHLHLLNMGMGCNTTFVHTPEARANMTELEFLEYLQTVEIAQQERNNFAIANSPDGYGAIGGLGELAKRHLNIPDITQEKLDEYLASSGNEDVKKKFLLTAKAIEEKISKKYAGKDIPDLIATGLDDVAYDTRTEKLILLTEGVHLRVVTREVKEEVSEIGKMVFSSLISEENTTLKIDGYDFGFLLMHLGFTTDRVFPVHCYSHITKLDQEALRKIPTGSGAGIHNNLTNREVKGLETVSLLDSLTYLGSEESTGEKILTCDNPLRYKSEEHTCRYHHEALARWALAIELVQKHVAPELQKQAILTIVERAQEILKTRKILLDFQACADRLFLEEGLASLKKLAIQFNIDTSLMVEMCKKANVTYGIPSPSVYSHVGPSGGMDLRPNSPSCIENLV